MGPLGLIHRFILPRWIRKPTEHPVRVAQGKDRYVLASTSLLGMTGCDWTTGFLVVGGVIGGLTAAMFLFGKTSREAAKLIEKHDPHRPSPGPPPNDI